MSTKEDTTTDSSTDTEDTRTLEEIASQATTGVENNIIGGAAVLHTYASDEGDYIEIWNNRVKSTRKLLTLIAGYAAELSDELDDPDPVTIVSHITRGETSTSKVELEKSDFEILDESDVAFRQRVVEKLERVL